MRISRVLLAVATAAASLAAHAADSKIPLPIVYPKPAFNGTPKPIRLPNLEPRQERPTQLLVTSGTTLLSKGRPVTASDTGLIIGEISFLTDGDKSGIDGTVAELSPGLQWVQIDLGAALRIAAIALWHFHSEQRAYHDVVVQISDDPKFEKNVTTVFNNDDDNSAKLGRGKDRPYVETAFGRLVDAKGTTGRYVRLYSNGNTTDELNHYCEVEVFGEKK